MQFWKIPKLFPKILIKVISRVSHVLQLFRNRKPSAKENCQSTLLGSFVWHIMLAWQWLQQDVLFFSSRFPKMVRGALHTLSYNKCACRGIKYVECSSFILWRHSVPEADFRTHRKQWRNEWNHILLMLTLHLMNKINTDKWTTIPTKITFGCY